MALTMTELRELLDKENFRYYLDPNQDAVMLTARGISGNHQIIVMLEGEGTFLQFRTIGHSRCPSDHQHLNEVLKVLALINYRIRLVKFGWDQDEGEIVAYADVWLQDGTLTQDQFHRMLGGYLATIDNSRIRIEQTMNSGKDPGEEDPEETAKRIAATADGSLPPALSKLVDELKGDGEGSDPGDAPKSVTEI